MYTLTPELQRYLKIVDPYMTLDELAVAFKVCMTVMIRLRKDMNLDPKPKGRPKNREAIIINGIIRFVNKELKKGSVNFSLMKNIRIIYLPF